MLTGYYDLAKCPPTYDVVSFLLALEQERIRRGEESIEIDILPGPVGGFRDDNLWPRSIEMRRHLLNKIVVPMCGMLPSCRRVTVHEGRPPKAKPSVGYGLYSMQFKNFVHAIESGIRPLCHNSQFNYDPSLVTLTLRECEHWPERNSKVDEWVKAAIAIRSMGRNTRVRIVRDARMADQLIYIPPTSAAMPEITTVPDASHDLETRAKLYRSAACNIFVSNGPAWFAMAIDAPALILRPATEGTHRLAGSANMRRNGIPYGGQIRGSPSHQRLVWEDDIAANIVDAFRDFNRTNGKTRPEIFEETMAGINKIRPDLWAT